MGYVSRRLAILLPALAIGCWVLLASAEVYRWQDEKGRVHYSDEAPESLPSSNVEVDLVPQGVRLVEPAQTQAWKEQALDPANTQAPNQIPNRPHSRAASQDHSELDLCAGVVGDCFSEQQDYVCKLRFGADCKTIYHWKVCLNQDCEAKKVSDKCLSPWHLLDRRPSVLVQAQLGRPMPLRLLVSERDWQCLSQHGFFCDEVASEPQCQRRFGVSCDQLKSWPADAQLQCKKQRGVDCDEVDAWLAYRPVSLEERKKVGNQLAGGGYQTRDLLLESIDQEAGVEPLWQALEALPGLNIRERRRSFDCDGEWRVYSPLRHY